MGVYIYQSGTEKDLKNAYIGGRLKSYEEIIAMSINDAVAELNTYPTEYYNKFNSENHMYGNCIGDSSLGRWDFANQQYNDAVISPIETDVFYSNGVWESGWQR